MKAEPSVAISKNGVPIRLSDERWSHIVAGHPELVGRQTEVLQTISAPTRVAAGAIYRELTDDGFVTTAFLTRRFASFQRRTQLWPSPESTNP